MVFHRNDQGVEPAGVPLSDEVILALFFQGAGGNHGNGKKASSFMVSRLEKKPSSYDRKTAAIGFYI